MQALRLQVLQASEVWFPCLVKKVFQMYNFHIVSYRKNLSLCDWELVNLHGHLPSLGKIWHKSCTADNHINEDNLMNLASASWILALASRIMALASGVLASLTSLMIWWRDTQNLWWIVEVEWSWNKRTGDGCCVQGGACSWPCRVE